MPTNSKLSIKQKTTWSGLALIGYSIYCFIVGNISEGSTSLVSGLGLLFAADNN